MFTHNRWLAGASLILFVAACAPKEDTANSAASATGSAAGTLAEPSAAEARSAIETINQRAATALLAGDAAGATAHYADDAVVMMPGMMRIVGKPAIDSTFMGMMGSMKVNAASFNTQDVMVGGDLAVETGTFSMTTTATGAKSVTEQGKYLSIWKRQADGGWKIVRDINNADPSTPTK